jgi:hypothetical protein
MLHRVAAFCFGPRSPLFEIALVLVRLDHIAGFGPFFGPPIL